ncbi:MAG: lytic transglycosylase domain-containing protein [Caulobacteraceae bacterium]|nr:lytic transglycosylase domain-containing protein [Caulobacteraceae bacterium]
MGALALTLPGFAPAQVLEIGEGGRVTVYDRPAVFDASGATPILKSRRPAPWRSESHGIQPALADAAQAVQLSPALVEAVAWTESRFRPGVVSRAGAVGEMQLMPGTARSLGVDPYDTRQNFRGGAAYLRALLSRYDGDIIRALAAYNAGPGAVDRWSGVPPFKETRDYVAAIMARLSQAAAPLVQADPRR